MTADDVDQPLYHIKLPIGFCYPEGSFGRNQLLLDGSITLSFLFILDITSVFICTLNS